MTSWGNSLSTGNVLDLKDCNNEFFLSMKDEDINDMTHPSHVVNEDLNLSVEKFCVVKVIESNFRFMITL